MQKKTLKRTAARANCTFNWGFKHRFVILVWFIAFLQQYKGASYSYVGIASPVMVRSG
jgi:hypothetical protein